MRWVIDTVDVVHVNRHCEMVFEHATDYKVTVPTTEAMVEHLAKPNIGQGHRGQSWLAPCDQCILDLPIDKGETG